MIISTIGILASFGGAWMVGRLLGVSSGWKVDVGAIALFCLFAYVAGPQ